MKELSIEEKAKAYDEALERAKNEYQTHKSFNGFRGMLARIFPELKENEDEKMKQAILGYLEGSGSEQEIIPGIKIKDALAWLEKQDEANAQYWRGYRESKQEVLDKYAEIDNSYANTSFPFITIVKSSNKRVNIIGGQLNSDCKYYIKYQSDEADGYRIYEPDEIFTELKESEDERIRKWIINEIKIKHHNLDEDNVDFVDKAIAWLEKQGTPYTKKDIDNAYLKGVTNTKK